MSKGKRAGYKSYPDLEPYTSNEYYGTPKEDFKTIGAKLRTLLDINRVYEVADLGCGNGALLYYIHKQYPNLNLYGYDLTAQYIETARSFEGLRDAQFFNQDIFQIQRTFDLILSTCLLSIYEDIQKPLQKMLDLCSDGGFVLATGLFNPFDVEVRVQFCDNTHPQTRGEWRSDFNRHSQRSIRDMFGSQVQWIEFEECPFNVKIPHDPTNPIRVWTIKDEGGHHVLINGAYQICNQTLMIMKK